MSKLFSIFALANENDHDWNIFTILGGSRSFQFLAARARLFQWKDAPGKKSKVSIFEDQWITS